MKYLLILIGSCVLLSCSKEPTAMEASNFIRWVENEQNGLLNQRSLGDFKFSLQYKPLEYVVLTENRTNKLKESELETRKEELENLQYYNFKISSLRGTEMLSTNIRSEEEYNARLYYFSALAQQDISLIDGSDTLPCLLYHFERNYGLGPYNNLVLAFRNTGKINNKTFVYNDQVLGTGPVKFSIKASDIHQTPTLKTY
jgi:hypothetical protein